jgi:hypothetical protein
MQVDEQSDEATAGAEQQASLEQQTEMVKAAAKAEFAITPPAEQGDKNAGSS